MVMVVRCGGPTFPAHITIQPSVSLLSEENRVGSDDLPAYPRGFGSRLPLSLYIG